MSNYFVSHDVKYCTGCGACFQLCTAKAITMQQNREGFYYPAIDSSKCTFCKKCENVCPLNMVENRRKIKECYALQDLDRSNLMSASSGGAFGLFAKYILDNDGVVFGAVFDKELRCIIASTDKGYTLQDMRGSKYVSANTLTTFQETKKLLQELKTVLYCATPCIIAGLKKFLGKDYGNLYTVDFACHGVPSQTMFDRYVAYESSKNAVRNVVFRDKSKYGCGKNQTIIYDKKRKYYISGLNPYMYGFDQGYFNRYACYECKYTNNNKYSDITIGDFWGAKPFHKSLNCHDGVSFVAINSNKGSLLFENIKSHSLIEETKIEYIGRLNKSLIENRTQEIPLIRNEIYEKTMPGFKQAVDSLKPNTKTQVRLKLRKIVPNKLICKLRKG